MASKKALVCDDDLTLVRILGFVLGKTGFSVHTSSNGIEALGALAKEKPDLFFLDLEMPDKDGFAVLKEMHAAGTGGIYTIVLSSHESTETHDRVMQLGAQEMWIKPFNAAELLKRIEGLISQGKV